MKPIAWYDPSNGVVSTDRDSPLFTPLGQVWPLFPKGEWVGLTEQEKGAIMENLNAYGKNLYEFAQAIEAKLKEKNT
jgi:hypothetical protein